MMAWWHTYDAQIIGRHMRIRRRDGKPISTTWDVIQQIKNDVVGPEFTCIEVFPAEPNVVNEANVRHLFVVPDNFLPSGIHWPEI